MNTFMMIARNIIHVFFGNPRRAQWTLIGIAVIYVAMNPLLFAALMRLGVVATGFALVWRAFGFSKKGGK